MVVNGKNHEQWPQVVSQDVQRQADGLKNNVYVVSGQVKGKTLLPLPGGQLASGRDKDDEPEK
jgi:dynein heavy chain